MGQLAATQGDQVTATDIHVVLVQKPGLPPPAVPTSLSFPFAGILDDGLSRDVRIGGRAAATVGSTATNTPPHVVVPPDQFQHQPTNRATVQAGSATVKINGQPAARADDPALTCNDPVDRPGRIVVPGGTVRIG
jgi:uncharacterized Zn-binding protein involved in type VI secretion